MKRLHRERAKHHNPLIGYHIVDSTYRVIGPPGTKLDPAFGSEAQAREAAEAYGRGAEVYAIVGLYWEGLLGVLRQGGEVVLDGEAAQRLVQAATSRGRRVNSRVRDQITVSETRAVYSSRELLSPSGERAWPGSNRSSE
jgi:hypothetical protein